MALSPGSRGSYEVTALIAQGGMGEVYRDAIHAGGQSGVRGSRVPVNCNLSCCSVYSGTV